jgi:hypothetical protein
MQMVITIACDKNLQNLEQHKYKNYDSQNSYRNLVASSEMWAVQPCLDLVGCRVGSCLSMCGWGEPDVLVHMRTYPGAEGGGHDVHRAGVSGGGKWSYLVLHTVDHTVRVTDTACISC